MDPLKKIETEAAISAFLESLEMTMTMMEATCKAYYQTYTHLIKAGFTEAQAMSLLRARGFYLAGSSSQDND